eukprot:comp6674_c0_seq1/m.2457 comp6674_c0_seq1/g.2457  ORF comp6674_c0_seq1/g.2457 comp6674_c0_seq1/m.2457 type:complete len:601 (-) comp6674_c0_seq1:395-2197(-)
MAALRRNWVERLSGLLLFDASDIVDYLLAMDTDAEMASYLENLLDTRQEPHQQAIRDMIRDRFPHSPYGGTVGRDLKMYRKGDDEGVLFAGTQSKKGPRGQGRGPKESPSTAHTQSAPQPAWQAPQQQPQRQQQGRPQQQQPARQQRKPTQTGSVKQTAKLTNNVMGNTVPLLSQEEKKPEGGGQAKKKKHATFNAMQLERSVMPGRRMCECQAQRHDLVGNCLDCGRVVCAQEGPGLCMFCGRYTVGDTTVGLASETARRKEKQRLKEEAGVMVGKATNRTQEEMDSGLEKALSAKERLLKFDAQSVQRTKVIDDENDYFEVDNRWLSKKERESRRAAELALQEAREKARNTVRITLDLAGRKVLQEDASKDVDETAFYPSDSKKDASVVVSAQALDTSGMGLFHNPDLKEAPKYVSSKPSAKGKENKKDGPYTEKVLRPVYRVQDAELSIMGDAGLCMSMHQPWASLLVAGIKTVEGRVWYTPHRGRLWIAAAAKVPTQDEIDVIERQYCELYNDPNMRFPDYPTGCLLGCVDVVECLTREEYLAQFAGKAGEESQSPYVFVCEHPQTLPIKFAVKGQHKIWKLDPQIHTAAKRALMH